MEHSYIIGMDFGTGSVRALLADAATGREVAVAVQDYARWSKGMYCDVAKSQFRHHPLDYIEGMRDVLTGVISRCPDPKAVRAIAVDTTASTPCLIDKNCIPLALTDGYEDNPGAMFVLWKDHTAQKESEEINALCARSQIDYAKYTGNHYSSECFWSKVLHLLRSSEKLRKDTWGAVELGDWIPALLTGCGDPGQLKTGNCLAGTKMMWAEEWGGYPPEEFFRQLDPVLLPLLRNLPVRKYPCDAAAGTLSAEWAETLGLSADVAVGIGNVDSYSGAVGAGIEPGTVVLNLGTSACYMALMPHGDPDGKMIQGISGQADGSIIEGYYGLEAGLSAFGDVYGWLKGVLGWSLREVLPEFAPQDEATADLIEHAESRLLDKLGEAAAVLKIDENTPLATDHLNGRRSPCPCSDLTAAVAGLGLSTTAPELFYAFAEATAFATKKILDHYENNGVEIGRLTGIGGIAQKSPFVMQLIADVTGKTIGVSDSGHSCALGSVVHAAVIAGAYPTVKSAQNALCPPVARVYRPDCGKKKILDLRYEKYNRMAKFAEDLMKTCRLENEI